jgi:hypothetical protein
LWERRRGSIAGWARYGMVAARRCIWARGFNSRDSLSD